MPPHEPRQDAVRIQVNVRIPTRDGSQLGGVLYLPKKTPTGPAPAILTMTPYIAQSHHLAGRYFAGQGYPFLSVDVRGRGNSEGRFDPRNEAADGFDIVEWLAQQPCCDGKVAMWGGSYLGRCQWAAAGQRPPHLRTIVPVASPYYGVDVPMRKNVFAAHTMRWLTTLAGRALQDKIVADPSYWTETFLELLRSGMPFRRLDELVGHPSSLFQEWLAHPHRDAYWDSYEPTADQYSRIDIPVLTITGAYDGDQLGALEHYRLHRRNASSHARADHYLIVGPWDHAGTGAPRTEFGGLKLAADSVLDMLRLHLEWYAWTLQGAGKPAFLRKNVAYYVTGAEKWRYADTLEEVTARFLPLYLGSKFNADDVLHSGSLDPEPTSSRQADHYRHDPRMSSLAEAEAEMDPESLIDQRSVYARRGCELVYHSSPFPADTEVAGFFRLTAWLSIDAPDADFRAAIHEVMVDGSSVQLTSDWLRARYRESPREARPIQSAAPLRYDFEHFPFVARQIRKGSRLRLVIGPIDSIFWQKNYNSGGDVADESSECAQVVNVRLLHDREHPSALYIPLGSGSAAG